MNNYYKRLEETKSLRMHANNLRAHVSKHNSFEFDIEEVANRFEDRARGLEKAGELRLYAESLISCSRHSGVEFDLIARAEEYENQARMLEERK